MRIASFELNGQNYLGLVDVGSVHPLAPKTELFDLMRNPEQEERLRASCSPPVPLSSVTLNAPITKPPQFIGIGLNYRDHAAESGLPLPTSPISFPFHQSAIVGPNHYIEIPTITDEVDWEAELGVVIGSKGRDITVARALEHVAGYTIINDVSARDIQAREAQLSRAKSLDTFKPIGPWIVTTDELTDPTQLSIELWVNDEKKQNSNTREMVFSVAEIISFLSQGTTLLPGAVIATGTPSGVGAAQTPQQFLHSGDSVTIAIEGIGQLTNPVRSSEAVTSGSES